MRVLLILSTLLFFSFSNPPEEGWSLFAKVKFTEKHFKELDEYYLVPFFDSKIRAFEGKEIQLKGYYIPLEIEDKKTMIISKTPNAECFFCGGSGPETVAEVKLTVKAPRLKADQVITVVGKLKLNDSDVTHMNFILEEARIIQEN
jgi:hypothetical protein